MPESPPLPALRKRCGRFMTDPTDKLPPAAVEAEYATLGSVIIDHRVLPDVEATGLTGLMFHRQRNTAVWDAIRHAYAEHGKVDMVLLTQRLVDAGMLDQVGGINYLTELYESVPSAASAEHYAKLVVEAYRKRQILDLAERMAKRVYSGDDKAEEQAWAAQGELESIVSGQSSSKVLTRREAAQAAYEELDDLATNGPSGLMTGFHTLDDCLQGLNGGNLYLIAARPGAGKTSLSLQVASNVAATGTPALFVSIEMPPSQIGKRDLAYASGLNLGQIRRPASLSRDQWGALQESVGRASEDMMILDASGMTIEAIESHARRLVESKKVGLVVIDYLQLMNGPAKMSKYEAVGHNSKSCKRMARTLDVPVILLSQLNRAGQHGDSRRPDLAQLRDSGEIEESADAVVMVHREDYYRLQKDQNSVLDHRAELIVAKNRHGPVGTRVVGFKGGAFFNHGL